eukprot:bmy_10464T0
MKRSQEMEMHQKGRRSTLSLRENTYEHLCEVSFRSQGSTAVRPKIIYPHGHKSQKRRRQFVEQRGSLTEQVLPVIEFIAFFHPGHNAH